MAVKTPLVLSTAGEIQQLQAGDTIPGGAPTMPDIVVSKHIISSNFTVTAGYGGYIPRYIEIAAGITVEIGADGDLEIG